MTYVIGDVHGEFDSLRILVDKLPIDSKLVFVGDLVDRGRKSKEVVNFVKKNNHLCTLGNHEKMMIDYVNEFEQTYPNLPSIVYHHRWINNGGKETLLSYEIIKIDEHGRLECIVDDKKFKKLLDDVAWIKILPLYIELDFVKDDKPIVVSHAPMAEVWHYRKDEKKKNVFEEHALWSRKEPHEYVVIFNIFGHTIHHEVDISKHFIDVDTGCCYKDKGYGKLSAYCIELDEVVSV